MSSPAAEEVFKDVGDAVAKVFLLVDAAGLDVDPQGCDGGGVVLFDHDLQAVRHHIMDEAGLFPGRVGMDEQGDA